MKILLVLIWALTTSADETLVNVLKSHQKTFSFYQSFKNEHRIHYQPGEDSQRLLNFIKSAQVVAALNSDDGRSANFELNTFSTWSASEKEQLFGANITAEDVNPAPPVTPDLAALPESKLWTMEGAVTPPEKQSACKASWAFAASNALDTQYKIATGILRNFAEQEFLDCAYNDDVDSCKGGFYNNAYQYSIDSGRLGFNRWNEYSYFAHSCDCAVATKRNALIAAKLTSYVKVSGSEESTIEALSHSAVSAAFEVTEAFMQYSNGVITDRTCNSVPNHAVALVGYTKTYVLAKNSWGHKWGDEGFVKFARNHDNCQLWHYGSYPVLTKTAESDDMGADDPVNYDHTVYDPHPDCATFTDKVRGCLRHYCDGSYNDGKRERCKATCNNCPIKFKFDPPHQDCDSFTDTLDSCDRVECFTANQHYLEGKCKGTCNNCPVPYKTVEPHPDCAEFTDIQSGCKLEKCYSTEEYRNRQCKGTCNHCREPLKLGPVHTDCAYFTDTITTCDRMRCFSGDQHYIKGTCQATCNNCPVPVKTPEPHPQCATFSDTQTNCRFEDCYRWEDYRNVKCKGTCNHCTEPLKLGPVHPDCPRFTDTIKTCDRMSCFKYAAYMSEGKCKATCNNCPVPIKTVPPHPNCANFSDTHRYCNFENCYRTRERDVTCRGTCNHCKEPIKVGPVHPDCAQFTDIKTNCDKLTCLTTKSTLYKEGYCKGTCNSCPVPIKTIPPHKDCAKLNDLKPNCNPAYCYNESHRKTCNATCNHCLVKMKPHPDCPTMKDNYSRACNKRWCTVSTRWSIDECQWTCNNCDM